MTLTSVQKDRVLMRIPDTRTIKILLIKQGLTQVQLGKAVGMTGRQYLNALISGRRLVSPNNPMAHRIADFLGQSIDRLFPLVDLQEIASSASPGCKDYKSPPPCQGEKSVNGDPSPPKKQKNKVRSGLAQRQKHGKKYSYR